MQPEIIIIIISASSEKRELELMPHRAVLQKNQPREEFNLIGHLTSCLSRVSYAHHSGM